MKSPRTEASTLVTALKPSPSHPVTLIIGTGPLAPRSLHPVLSFIFFHSHVPSPKPNCKAREDRDLMVYFLISWHHEVLCNKVLNNHLFMVIIPIPSLFAE